ncbi:hypothetical protein GGI20_003694 [Coemansia sp. BCRC 34301]|nr:hypothetical protein GGI20_003694 [Coemansia sp. BCRC 34301]
MDMTAAADGDAVEAVGSASAQLQLYQVVPLHVDNLYPYTRSLPFRTVPSPGGVTGARAGHQEQLAAHLGGYVKSALYTLHSQPDTCIQWRILDDRKSLELRPLRWISGADAAVEQPEDEDQQLLPAVTDEAMSSVTSTWCFATPLIDSVVVADEVDSHGQLQVSVIVCSQDGVVYRLSFASAWEISSDSVDAGNCTSWYQIEWCHDASGRPISGRMPTMLDGLGSNLLAVGCEDTALVWLQWQDGSNEVYGDLNGYIAESVSSASGILQSVKEFIPRMLRRGASTVSDYDGAPNRIVSFALAQALEGSVSYAITLSRDRKLRFWASGPSSACQHEVLLPQIDILGHPIPVDPHGQPLPPIEVGSRNYIRTISHSMGVHSNDSDMVSGQSNAFGVVVFVPDEATPYFTLLQITVDEQSRISNVQTIMYKACKAANGASQLMADDELVDFQISHHEELQPTLVEGPNGQPVEEEIDCSYWTLWALWERSQELVVTHMYFSLRPSNVSGSTTERNVYEFAGHPVLGERWYTVLSQHRAMQPTTDGPYIKEVEARLTRATSVSQGDNSISSSSNESAPVLTEQADSDDNSSNAVQTAEISRVFLDHLFHPLRFDRGVLDHALALYEGSARDRGFGIPAAAYAVTSASPNLRQRVAAVVGSFLRVETSRKSGAMLVGDFQRSLFTEWMRYSTLCSRLQRTANAPKALSLCRSTNMVCVATSNSIMALQAASEVEWMHALTERDPAASVLLSAPEPVICEKYPDVAQGNARVEVARLLAATSYLSNAMATDRLAALTNDMAREANGEILVSYEARAVELFEKYAAESITPSQAKQAARLLGLCQTPGDTISYLVQELARSAGATALLSDVDDPRSFRSSASMVGMFASAFAISANARFELSRDISLLLICIVYHYEAMKTVDIGNIPSVLSTSLGVFNLFAVSQWVASQSIGAFSDDSLAEDPSSVDGFLRKFSVLNINRRRDSAGSVASKPAVAEQPVGTTSRNIFVYSMLHDILSRSYAIRFTGLSGSFADMITEGVQQIYATLGFAASWIGNQAADTESQVNLVLFAAKLEKAAPPELTELFLRHLPKTTASFYLGGLVSLRLRDYGSASDFFANASVFYGQVSEGIRDSLDLHYVLPRAIADLDLAASYYEHVSELFETAHQFSFVSRFAHLALQALQEDAERETPVLAANTRREWQKKLWFKIFYAELERNSYEQAYMAMMANPDQEQKLGCLRHLTSVLCEREGGVATLCRLSFPGLHEEVERNLLFKARHSDLLAKPNYFRILYSFHVYRGNYRNAASAMYQYARRLSVLMLQSGDVARILLEQGQALLACVNGLSLVDAQYAWVVVGRHGATDGVEAADAGDGCVRRKRRRIAIGRYDTSSSSQGQDIDIVELADVRREYTLCMARITLGATFQELFSRNVLLEPEDAVALYVKTGMYDKALSFAKIFGLKLDYILTTLAKKCLELSAAQSAKVQREQTPDAFWDNAGIRESTGSPSERAWRLLRHYLDLEEPTEQNGQRYRLLVADAILGAECDSVLAPWLSSLLLRRCPQDLVRLCLRNGCVTEGAEFLLQHISTLRQLVASTAVAKTTREVWLPYQLLDQTMGILDDAIVRFEEAVAKIRDAKKQGGSDADVKRLKYLLKSYRERLASLQCLRADLKTAFDQYMVIATRESRDISEALSPAKAIAA